MGWRGALAALCERWNWSKAAQERQKQSDVARPQAKRAMARQMEKGKAAKAKDKGGRQSTKEKENAKDKRGKGKSKKFDSAQILFARVSGVSTVVVVFLAEVLFSLALAALRLCERGAVAFTEIVASSSGVRRI